MESSHNTASDGKKFPSSAEQQLALEALVARYEKLLSEAQEASHDWGRIFDAIEDPICVVTADYRLVHANAAYIRLFGSTYSSGRHHYCFSSNADDAYPSGPCADCPLLETVRTHRAGFAQQEWHASVEAGESGGSPQPVTYQRWTYPVINADGSVDRVVEVIKDVTEQERMRRTINKTEALREADRLKAELLGTVSHELRSPLTAIKGYAATLLRHERRLPREERREFLEAIGEASDRLEVIINRLLEMSQLEIGSIVPHRVPVDVAQIARDAIAIEQQRSSASAAGKYVFHLHLLDDHGAPERTLPLIEADNRLLRDVLDNLLENAVKFSPEGGTIDVTLSVTSAAGAQAATSEAEVTDQTGGAAPPTMLEIVVRDSGRGIPAEHLGRVFERFHRVDTRLTREVDGLGLGLAMCKRIAELHGGSIWAESAPGEGSAFHLLLPLVDASAKSERLLPVP